METIDLAEKLNNNKAQGALLVCISNAYEKQVCPWAFSFPLNKGRVTNSPPAKVKIMNKRRKEVLASGIDSLNLAVNVNWKNDEMFSYLKDLKMMAQEKQEEVPGKLGSGKITWNFIVPPYGIGGYEWVLKNDDMFIKMGNWKRPTSRPSMMIEFRSEALWRESPEALVDWLLKLIFSEGGGDVVIKPSRVDLCIDTLFPEMFWTPEFAESRVTRATAFSAYHKGKKFTGVSIGGGDISARIYDKAYEIKTQSKKNWMYQIWGISRVPQGQQVIRIEFQLRREMLKQLSMNDIYDLLNHSDNAWGYCSQNWLKFQSGIGKHHTQRKTLDWWETVQHGFLGTQNPQPLIRCVSLKGKIEQLFAQAKGNLISILAKRAEISGNETISESDLYETFLDVIREKECSDIDLQNEINRKIAKNCKISATENNARNHRKQHGFPTEI